VVTRGRESSFELLRLASEHDGGTYVLHVTGELDLLSSGALRYELDRALASGADRIVLDLSGLTFIDARCRTGRPATIPAAS
jgi:anti-anti-sigma factor